MEKQELLPLEGIEPVTKPPSFVLGPYITAYHRAYGLAPTKQAIGRMARTLKELEEQIGIEPSRAAYLSYVTTTPAQFYSIGRFIETLPAWTGNAPVAASRRGSDDPLPGESVDAYIARVGGRSKR